MNIEEDVSYISWSQYSSSAGYYDTKILYTSTELAFDDGTETVANSIIFGASIDLYMSQPFIFREGRKSYESKSLVDSDEDLIAVRLQAASGSAYWDVYVCNGVIMTRMYATE